MTLEEAQAALREARGRRAWLATRREASLDAARARVAAAVSAHDAAEAAHRSALANIRVDLAVEPGT